LEQELDTRFQNLDRRLDTIESVQDGIKEVLNLILARLIATCTRYEFRLTPRKGNFEQARQMCKEMNGDLLQVAFERNGLKHKAAIVSLINMGEGRREHGFVVGMTDMVTEGEWRLIKGSRFDERDGSQMGRWHPSQPDDWKGNEDCVQLYKPTGKLIDIPCLEHKLGICELLINEC